MNNFAIVLDSSCDMSSEMRKRFNIDALVRGVVYKPDGSQMLSDLDWETMTPEQFYDSMKGRKILYKTATPPVGEIIEKFEALLQAGRDILSISLSTGLSGTHTLVQNTANDLLKKYPERKIICIDSLRYASAIMLLAVKASEKRASGATLEETAAYIEELKHHVHQMGPLDDLFFCAKTGRITNFQAFFGTLIGIVSLGDFSPKGITSVLGKVKGKPTALAATVKYIEETIENPEEQTIFIAHSNRAKTSDQLAQMLRETLNPKEILINPIGMSCGSSIGPGLCAAYFIGKPVSDENIEEKQRMETIIKDLTAKK